ncbi:hypothetical protein M433DRAFT_149644 [Acidomyces richmondensis BFW]|nr:MAG: hypothetical protein FE78DRAFT_91372 [Acidomyces sp. 'richmondensis']KYG49796.1 hypothetical protein M433DRAFT_149644 [Acidomyces richmondensis BFW]
MPICIECRYPVSTLYTTYSKADDKALGKGVRLTQCPRCKRFADKYVEHDYVVQFIDLVLIKPQVYRHLLFNELGRDIDVEEKVDVSNLPPPPPTLSPPAPAASNPGHFLGREPLSESKIIRFGTLLLLFDVYLTWARIEKATSSPTTATSSPLASSSSMGLDQNATTVNGAVPALGAVEGSYLATQPILLQYLFFLVLCALETLSFHLPIRTLLSLRLPSLLRKIVPYYPHPALVSTAILVSSFTKLFPLLLLVWQYDLPSSASAVSWAVIINNVAALEILLDCGYVRAALLCAIGAVCRAAVGWCTLRAVGIGGGAAAAGVVETSDLIDVWKRLM